MKEQYGSSKVCTVNADETSMGVLHAIWKYVEMGRMKFNKNTISLTLSLPGGRGQNHHTPFSMNIHKTRRVKAKFMKTILNDLL